MVGLYCFKRFFDFFIFKTFFTLYAKLSNNESKIKARKFSKKKGYHTTAWRIYWITLLTNHKSNRKGLNIIASNLDIKKPYKKALNTLTNALNRFLVDRKLNKLGLNNWTTRHISLKDIDRLTKLNELSHSTLKKLGELQQIKNYDTISREDLIYALLRSKNPNEHNYITHITNNIDTNNIDNEIRGKINDIRQSVTNLGNLLSNKERKEITKELYESLRKINNTNWNTRLRRRQKERLLTQLINQNNELVKKKGLCILIMTIYSIEE